MSNDTTDTEYEEEEMYLYADFGSKLPLEIWEDRNLYVKVIGMDTSEPIIQINGKIFKGISFIPFLCHTSKIQLC